MAEVAVLPPQNCLAPHHHHHHQRHHQPHRNPKPTHKRRNSPPPRATKARTQARPITPPIAGPIRILKRGEDMPVLTPQPKPVAESEPVMRLDGFYAGSGFVTSPPPSSVPLPAFFTAGRRNSGATAITEADVIATDLKRLLNLQ